MSLSEKLTTLSHQRGERMTSQRRNILDTLEAMPGHPTAEELYERVRQSDASIHLSTVYRTLRWLESLGVICHRHFADDRNPDRFDAGPHTDHYHFRCQTCGKIMEFDQPLVDDIKARYAEKTGATIDNVDLTLYGTCAACQTGGVRK